MGGRGWGGGGGGGGGQLLKETFFLKQIETWKAFIVQKTKHEVTKIVFLRKK